MAEYYISYSDLENVLSKFIAKSTNQEFLTEHKSEMLAALTGNFEENNSDAVKNLVSFWENQIEEPAQLLVGRKYILMQSVLCDFLEMAITSGAVETMILFFMRSGNVFFPLTGTLSIAFGLWKVFSSVKELDDDDFCVYMQTMTHYREYKKFTKDDLMLWFPNGNFPKCNMHNSTWNCEFLGRDDTCSMVCANNLDKSIKALIDKGLLVKEKVNDGIEYKFKW